MKNNKIIYQKRRDGKEGGKKASYNLNLLRTFSLDSFQQLVGKFPLTLLLSRLSQIDFLSLE